MHVKEKRDEMLALEVAARMVAYAWYPIEYFHLLFGKGDQMEDVIKNVSFLTKITVDDKLEDKKNIISDFVFSNKQEYYMAGGLNMKVLLQLQKP